MANIENTVLGQKVSYINGYDNKLLHPIPRSIGREENQLISTELPFKGVDIWNCYEVSWLDSNGMPQVRILRFIIDCNSENIIESKSLKLYLYSLNNHVFENEDQVINLIQKDLTMAAKHEVSVVLYRLSDLNNSRLSLFSGKLLDEMSEIKIEEYNTNKSLLQLSEESGVVTEKLYSNLLKSNCLITNQPDWASIYIEYKGRAIDHSSLLKYIISFRNHNEFHEQCVERIFGDILDICRPEELTIYAKYTRRGGIDINPLRTNVSYKIQDIDFSRDIRQ